MLSIMKIILNIIGILIFFLNRFSGRKDKTKAPSLAFWLKDNWGELTIIALFDVALMMLVFQGGLEFNFEKLTMLPDGIQLAGDGALCFIIGLILSWGAYVGYQKLFKSK